jgi:hypothetical protein
MGWIWDEVAHSPPRRRRPPRWRQLAAAGEDRQAIEEQAFLLEQQVVAPVHHGSQGLLAEHGGPGTTGQQPETVVEPFRQRRQGKGTEAGGRQLDGQGKPVQPAAYFLHDLSGLPVGTEAGLHRPGPVDEELHGDRFRQASHRNHNLAGDAQRLTARGDESQTRDLAHQALRQFGRSVDHVLTVVEHDDEGSAGEVVADEIYR